MSAREHIIAYAEECDIELIFFDPPETFDAAIVGVIHGYGQEPAVLYDQEEVLAAMIREGMSRNDALEWFDFNTIGAYVGVATPRFLLRPPKE